MPADGTGFRGIVAQAWCGDHDLNVSIAARFRNPARWFLTCCSDRADVSESCDVIANDFTEWLLGARAGGELWPQQSHLCEARPRLCKHALLWAWKAGVERRVKAGKATIERNATWCVQQAAKLRFLDPDAFATEEGPPQSDEDVIRNRGTNTYAAWMEQCAQLQVRYVNELAAELLFSKKGDGSAGESIKRHETPAAGLHGSIGVLLAVAGQAKETFEPYFNWWRCYCEQHGFRFFLDSVEPPDLVPADLDAILHGRSIDSSPHWSLSHHDVQYIKQSVTRFAWLRWLSARKYLRRVDWLIIIEPDMVPSPGCGMEIPLTAFTRLCCSGHCECDLVLGDMLPHEQWRRHETTRTGGVPLVNAHSGEDMNTGFAMIKNSPRGWLFLELVLQRRAWPGLGMPDQDAAGEAVLEMLSLERKMTTHEPEDALYRGQCLPRMFHRPRSMQDPRLPWSYSSANYGYCWHFCAESLAGPVGQRQSKWIGFAHPWRGNLNARPFFDGTWQIPNGGWRGASHGVPRKPEGLASRSGVILHFAGLGPYKRHLMDRGLMQHYGVRPNISCSALQLVVKRPRSKTNPACGPLEVFSLSRPSTSKG